MLLKKASIQISVNFLVVMIISLIIMGLGVTLLRNMMTQGGQNIADVDQQLEERIESLLGEDGKSVSVPIVQRSVKRGDAVAFGVGVMNIDGDSNGNDFSINVSLDEAYETDGAVININNCGDLTCPKYNPTLNEQKIENNEKATFPVPIMVPENTESGQYIFDLKVCKDVSSSVDCGDKDKSDTYDKKIHKLYVKVP